ncbi:MAG TPA: Mrp/NBP35 family ATP-binding protein [Anaerolineaceae bacterium]
MSSNLLTVATVMKALERVQEPELGKDLVSLNMIRDVKVVGGNVSFTVILTTPACPLKRQIEDEARTAVMALPGVETVEVKFDSNVPQGAKKPESLNLPIKHIVAIASGKGGVGKTTVAVNISIALAIRGAKVGLLDADIYGPNVPTMIGIGRLPPQNNEKLRLPEAFGVKVMSMGFLVKPGQPLIWRGPMLHSAIRQFLSDADWGELDYLIVDMPPGTGDVQLSLAQTIDLSGGVIVTLPQAVSLEDASRGLEMFRVMKIPVLGVVENMSYLDMPDGSQIDIFGTGGGEQMAKAEHVPFLGGIPIDPQVRKGGDEGIPVVISQPESKAARSFFAISERIAARLSVQAAMPGMG